MGEQLLVCFRCGKTPDELSEYLPESTDSGLSPTDYVLQEEGTLNMSNGHFACTDCYIQIGMPTTPRGWKAP
jgi:hypothetical protein